MDYIIDYNVVEDLYGSKFRILLEDLGITTFIDVNERIKVNHQYTSASSIWFYGHGDFDFNNKKYGRIIIQSGCLASVKSFRKIPFGTKYYENHMGKHMITEDEYFKYVNAFETAGSNIGDAVVVNKTDAREILKKFIKVELENDIQQYTNENKRLPLTGAKIYTITSWDNKKYYYKGLHQDLFT